MSKASTFLHGKAKKAALKGKEAAGHRAWQGCFPGLRNGKYKIAEGRHEGMGQQDVCRLIKEMRW